MQAVAADHVTKRFDTVVAVSGLDLHVEQGAVFGLLGPNGAGKTTSLRMIMNILVPDEGTIQVLGQPASERTQDLIGYLPEERGLYPAMGVLDHLVYLARLHGVSKAEATERAQAWLERLGLGVRGEDKVEALSLGNQQRVQLIAALVHQPEVLVLDEPFSGLDPTGVAAMSAVLAEQAADGRTVLFSSHQLDLVEDLCETVAIVNGGRLVAEGPVDQLQGQGRSRLAVRVAGDRAGRWAEGLAGVSVAGNDGGTVRLLLDAGTDPQDVLAAARAAGPVEHFATERRQLSEVFAEAVQP